MNKIRIVLYLFFILCLSYNVNAQEIKRWTFCSTGKIGYYISSNKDSIAIEPTFGQCPGCTVLNGGSTIVRQGYQQPLVDRPMNPKDTLDPNNGGGTGLPPCAPNDPAGNFTLDFSPIAQNTPCGVYYDFEYTGDVKPNMKFAWNFGPTGVPQFSKDQEPKKVGFTSKGFKYIRLEGGVTCSKSITKVLEVKEDAFVGQAKSNTEIKCKGQKTGSITLSIFGGTAPYNYKWSNGLPNATSHKSLGGGNYGYTVTDTKGCEFTGSVVIVEPKDSLKVIPKIKDETCRDTKDGQITLTVKGGTAPYAFLWSDNADIKDRTNLSIGILSVTVTDDNDCVATAKGDVKRYCDKGPNDFPNTFTPNGDGINDGFDFPGIDDFPNNVVEIYNRWGQLVYSKKGYKSGDWKGDNGSGQPLPAGPYYYVIKLNDRDKTVFTGSVTIIR